MITHVHSLKLESIWEQIRRDAEELNVTEPAMRNMMESLVLSQPRLTTALCALLASKISTPDIDDANLRFVFNRVYLECAELEDIAVLDLAAILKNDPAAHNVLTPFLFFKGFHALQCYRIANFLWQHKQRGLALHIQNRVSDLFGADIHPAAAIGRGIMLDHATGIVIGETAVVEDDVMFWHGVTLGGKGITGGDRHPKIRKGAMLGANCTILGPIEIGAGAKIGAGAIVVDPVPAGTTVVPPKAITK